MQLTHEILDRLERLEKKYAVMGQDILSYLDGLLYADYLTYWDYIHLDTLLSLQTPRTPIPDEEIFIMYHQITELYFKLIIKAMNQVLDSPPDVALFKRQLQRLVDYFDHLSSSFGVMIEGMDKEEFLKFRMSLLPASGFQSAQYRMIEIMSTDVKNLVHHSKRDFLDTDIAEPTDFYPYLYWKYGATELSSGKKTLTLRQFEEKYNEEFHELLQESKTKNLWQAYLKLTKEEQQDEELLTLMKRHDINANVNWPLVHYKAAARYLNRKPMEISATGGTNWQKYLPPKNQRVIFYPEIWTDEELDDWGKGFTPLHSVK